MGIPRNGVPDKCFQSMKFVERTASVAIYSESADSLVAEHEHSGCVVASSALQNKYHSLLHPRSIL